MVSSTLLQEVTSSLTITSTQQYIIQYVQQKMITQEKGQGIEDEKLVRNCLSEYYPQQYNYCIVYSVVIGKEEEGSSDQLRELRHSSL